MEDEKDSDGTKMAKPNMNAKKTDAGVEDEKDSAKKTDAAVEDERASDCTQQPQHKTNHKTTKPPVRREKTAARKQATARQNKT